MRRISVRICWSEPGAAWHHLAWPDPAEAQGGKRRVEGGYTVDQFEVDWAQQRVRCPQGKWSLTGGPGREDERSDYFVEFAREDCQRLSRTGGLHPGAAAGRRVGLPPQAQYEALRAARTWYGSAEGKEGYKRRAGVEGTLSQGVRAFGLRCARYRGLAKTHLQHVATAAAMNVDRIVAWLDERPRAKTRTSRFAALAPTGLMPSDMLSV